VPNSLSAQPAGAADEALWVVCLCAEWCGACREYRPLFDSVAKAHPGLQFAWVDVEDHADIADDFDVETFPTILVASQAGTRFIGPMLPHAETLKRMLMSLPSAQSSSAEVNTLLDALRLAPHDFKV